MILKNIEYPNMRSKVTLGDKSIDNAGIPSDYKLAISEYIWNGFDAKATNVDIQFKPNEIGYISFFPYLTMEKVLIYLLSNLHLEHS